MMIRLKSVLQKLNHIVKRRTFFVRLLATTLFAAFIPLTIVSGILIKRESNRVTDMVKAQLESAAETSASQFDEYVNTMNLVSNKLLLSSKLSETTLSKSVQNELDAIELINNYSGSLPFVENFAVYMPNMEVAYCAAGKMRRNGFLQHIVKQTDSQFDDMLSEINPRGFYPWDAQRGNIIYMYHFNYVNENAQPHRMVYVLTLSSITNAMSTTLFDSYGIVNIRSNDGTIIYDSGKTIDSDCLTCEKTSTHGYSVTLYTLQTNYMDNIEAIAVDAQLVSVLCIILCVVLIVTVVTINYKPLAELVGWIRPGSQEQASELDSIYDFYAKSNEEKKLLSSQLYERTLLFADKIIEDLLHGHSVSQSNLDLLELNMPYYRVVCAELDKVKNVSELISRNAIGSPIYVIEMYSDKRLAFVCGCTDDSDSALQTLSDVLHKILHSNTINLGFSTPYISPDRLFMAYMEAGCALLEDCAEPDHIAVPQGSNSIYILNENARTLEELTVAIRTADNTAIRYAEKAFDQIQSSQSSTAAQRYACYQLIELYRHLSEEVGIEMDIERLSQILQESSIAVLKEHFLKMLEEIQLTQKAVPAPSNNASVGVIQYIRENYTDPDFSMNDIADHLGVSIYTASRVLKALTGVTFRKYLNDMRIDCAKNLLLTTELTVQDISAQSGFSSTSYFIKIFKESEDSTPNNYRLEHNHHE